MQPLVGVIMGSQSDWTTLQHTADTLESLGVPCEVRVLSAHRTPDQLAEYAESAERRGLEVIIAGAGGAAALPGARTCARHSVVTAKRRRARSSNIPIRARHALLDRPSTQCMRAVKDGVRRAG